MTGQPAGIEVVSDRVREGYRIVGLIGRAARVHRQALDAEEAKARGGKPEPHPLPTKDEAWQAFLRGLADHEEPVDAGARERFEAWWLGIDR